MSYETKHWTSVVSGDFGVLFSRKRKTDLESCFKHIAIWMSMLLLVAFRTKNAPRGQLWRQLLMWSWLLPLANSIKIERNMRNHWRILRHCRALHLLLCPGSERGFFCAYWGQIAKVRLRCSLQPDRAARGRWKASWGHINGERSL